jgi:hypothetical protein
MRDCSVTQRRVASLFQNVRCAIATASVSLMPRCPSVSGTVNDPPKMASAERVAVTPGLSGERLNDCRRYVVGPFAMMIPRGCGARTGARLFAGSVFQTSALTILWTITAMQVRHSIMPIGGCTLYR